MLRYTHIAYLAVFSEGTRKLSFDNYKNSRGSRKTEYFVRAWITNRDIFQESIYRFAETAICMWAKP
jgi:hypothetical protein